MQASTPAGVGAAPLDAEVRALLWRCRRGMKELDLVLERYARGALAGASPELRQSFAELLTLPDPLLAGYLLGGQTPPEPPLARLTGAIRTYVAKPAGVRRYPEPGDRDSAEPLLNFQGRSQST